MLENRLKITFESLDMEVDNYIKQHEWSDIYEEVRLVFDTFLGVIEEYEEKYIEENPYLGTFNMKRKVIIYSVNYDCYSHTKALVNMLNVLDVDCCELYRE